MEIVTARLRLDALGDEDAAALFAYRGDPTVSRFQGWKPASVADAARFIAAQRDVGVDAEGQWWQRAIRLRDSGELIGDVGLRCTADAAAELGISIAPRHQRRGYAGEVVEVLLDFAFGGLRKHRVFASVDPRNVACVKLLENVGMRREAHFVESPRNADDWTDDVVFALLAREWLAPERQSD